MNNAISFIKENIIASILLFLVVFQYSNFFRVAMRCIYEGSDFQWMQTWGVSILGKEKAMRIMGNGYEGHFLIMVLLAVFFVAVVFVLIRRQNDSLGKLLVLSFTGVMAAKEIMLSIAYGDQYRVVGETFRLNLDYSIIGPTLSISIFIIALVWTFKNNKQASLASTSTRVNLVAALLAIPCFLLLRLGDQHDWSDIIGISFIYIQLLILIINWTGAFNRENEDLIKSF